MTLVRAALLALGGLALLAAAWIYLYTLPGLRQLPRLDAAILTPGLGDRECQARPAGVEAAGFGIDVTRAA